MTGSKWFRAERALVGKNLESLSPAYVHVENGRIVEVGPGRTSDGDVTDLADLTLIPGFIDCHVHMGLADPHEVLAGGVTTVRDLAWPPKTLASMLRDSRAPGYDGPLILGAGQMLTTEGGYPTRAAWAPEGTARVVDDATDPAAAVDEQVRLGACVIKVALNPETGPTLPTDTLRAIVEAAHERGLRVTGHVAGLEELRKALDTEMDELAHMLMSSEEIPDDDLARMVEADMTVVPTLACRFDDQGIAIRNLSRFRERGGRVVYGTDLGNEGPGPGIDRREVSAMYRAGFDTKAIIRSATVDAAEWLGLAGRGVIEPGAVADLTGVEGDPSKDPSALLRVAFVMREGRVHVLSAASRGDTAP